MKVLAFLTIIFLHTSFGFNKLPPYIKACSVSDPNFQDCAFKSGQAAMPMIIDGDPIYHIPSFKPFKIEYVSLEASENIKLYANNVEIYGIDGAKLEELTFDLDKKCVTIKLFMPVLSIVGTYNMNGRILIMNLRGSGPMNNSHFDNHMTIKCEYSIVTRNNKEYAHVDKVNMDLKMERVVFNFYNLFNNTQLSEQMNAFLNENWKILIEDLYPSVNQILSDITISIINFISSKIPYDNVFLP